MSRDTLEDLTELTGALYRAEQARMRDLVQQETSLRQALAQLEDHRKAALSLPAEELHAVRQIGADILWQGWVGRNREELNRQLALCLVQKARHLTALRKAYGKHQASEALLEQEKAAHRKILGRRQTAQEQEQSLIRASQV
ncbi:hypothetical protein [Roseovarius sp. 2305UL8-3]|uniref:hypothetical protein n=1 Tax=Roseovarius conchicola TaxID=3121636 RepID=UPI003526EB77